MNANKRKTNKKEEESSTDYADWNGLFKKSLRERQREDYIWIYRMGSIRRSGREECLTQRHRGRGEEEGKKM